MNIFEEKPLVKVCAPMVRYSRLPFRLLVREYDCDLAFSPMIMADSFVKSEKCRINEFKCCNLQMDVTEEDRPLIVQFASNEPTEFAQAAELVKSYCDGVDLNCGCPQRWIIQEKRGCWLLNSPELISDMVKQTRNRISDPDFTISVKIRVFNDLKKTVDLCRQLESCGISFLTVHGRTVKERCEPVRLNTIQTIVDSLNTTTPVIANGDINSLEDCYRIQNLTGVRGVMSARGILENPSLFTGQYNITPVSVVKRWIEINQRMDAHKTMFHRHLISMTEKLFTKPERREFNNLVEKDEIIQYLTNKFEFTIDEGSSIGTDILNDANSIDSFDSLNENQNS